MDETEKNGLPERVTMALGYNWNIIVLHMLVQTRAHQFLKHIEIEFQYMQKSIEAIKGDVDKNKKINLNMKDIF